MHPCSQTLRCRNLKPDTIVFPTTKAKAVCHPLPSHVGLHHQIYMCRYMYIHIEPQPSRPKCCRPYRIPATFVQAWCKASALADSAAPQGDGLLEAASAALEASRKGLGGLRFDLGSWVSRKNGHHWSVCTFNLEMFLMMSHSAWLRKVLSKRDRKDGTVMALAMMKNHGHNQQLPRGSWDFRLSWLYIEPTLCSGSFNVGVLPAWSC